MIFDLAQNFHDAVAAMPPEYPKHGVLQLFEQCIRREISALQEAPGVAGAILYQALRETCRSDIAEILEQWREGCDSSWLKCIHIPQREGLEFLCTRLTMPSRKAISGFAFAPSHQVVLAMDSEGYACAWNIANGQQVLINGPLPQFDMHFSHTGYRCDLPSMFRLCLVGYHGEICFQTDAEKVRKRSVHTTAREREITITNALGVAMRSWRPHGSFITTHSFLGGTNWLATGSEAGEIAVWNIDSVLPGEAMNPGGGHRSLVAALSLNIDGTRCVSIGQYGHCVIWNTACGRIAGDIAVTEEYRSGSFVSCRQGTNQFVVEMPDGEVKLLDANTGQICDTTIRRRIPPDDLLDPAQYRPRTMARCSGKLMWGTNKCRKGVAKSFCTHLPTPTAMCDDRLDKKSHECDWHPVGIPSCDFLAVSGHDTLRLAIDAHDRLVHVMDLGGILWSHQLDNMRWDCSRLQRRTGDDYGELIRSYSHRSFRSSVLMQSSSVYTNIAGAIQADRACDMALDGSQAIVGDDRGLLAFISLKSESPRVCTLQGHAAPVIACMLRDDGKYAVSIGWDNLLIIWDTHRVEPVTYMPLRTIPACCAFSGDGSMIGIGLAGGSVLFYQLEGIERCRSLSDERVAKNESRVANDLRKQIPEAISRIDDPEVLLHLIQDTPKEIVSAAAKRRVIALAEGGWGLDKHDRKLVLQMTHHMCAKEDDATIRLAAIEATVDESVLSKISSTTDDRIARRAAEVLSYLRDAQAYEVTAERAIGGYEATCLCKLFGSYDGSIRIRSHGAYVEGKSLSNILMLQALKGSIVYIWINPLDRDACFKRLSLPPFTAMLAASNRPYQSGVGGCDPPCESIAHDTDNEDQE